MSDEVFDTIVVGSGSAGSAFAGRLSQTSSRRILLLEAGPVFERTFDFPQEALDARAFTIALPGHQYNWGFIGALTDELNYPVPRARLMGGSGATNGGYFIRGVQSDFDRWSNAGNDLWSADQVTPYYRRIETDLDFPGPNHGATGPVPVKRDFASRDNPLVEAFLESATGLGFPFELDKNAGGQAGAGFIPQNVVNGQRINAAIAYLCERERATNLVVRGGQFVRRILFENHRATGVEIESLEGEQQVLRAPQIVLCAGAVKSPHILLLSGIGPQADLKAHGIGVVHASAGVGRDFTDHPHINVTYRTRRSYDLALGGALVPVCLNWSTDSSRRGGDIEILARMAPFRKATLGAAKSGTVRGHVSALTNSIRALFAMQGVSLGHAVRELREGGDMPFAIGLQQPDSRGVLRLASPDPRVQPSIAYNYLSEPSDLVRLRQAVRLAAELLESASFCDLGAQRAEPGRETLASDRLLDDWIRKHLSTAVHLTSTCRMGPDRDPDAVVDQHGRVKGVEGVWVADPSILPDVPSRGVNATAVMIGDRVADFVGAA